MRLQIYKLLKAGFILMVVGHLNIFITGNLKAQTTLNSLQFIDPKQTEVSFPFKFINNLIIIPLEINNSDSLFFILDTGLNISILTELSLGDSLSLNYTKQVTLKGLGKGNPIKALHSFGNEFRISGVRGYYQHIYIILQNVFNLSSMLGTRVHGLIGYNLFKEFVVEIDYEKKLITLHRPETYKIHHKRKSKTLPIILDNTKPYIYATVVMNDNTEIKVKLLIDTGASHSLWLDKSSDPKIKVPEKSQKAYLGAGLNGEINGLIGRINSIRISDFEFERPIVAFPDSSSAGFSFGLNGRNGSLGSEILRRFHIIIDYPHNQLTLRPNKHYREPFKINRSGIELISPVPGIPYYTISMIKKNSPGDLAGLKPGDVLYSINHNIAKAMSINDIYEYLQGEPGRKLRVVVIRNGLYFVTYFYLEDLFN
jgi:hypothetical protein